MQNDTVYKIHVRGMLDEKWAAFFAPFALTYEEDDTMLTGVIHDQAELLGILIKIRDSGLSLVSLAPLTPPSEN